MSWNWTQNETATRPPLLCSIVSRESPPTPCQSRASSCFSWCNAPSRAVWGTGCSSDTAWLSIPISSRHNQSKTVTWMRFPETLFLLSLRQIVFPHYKTDVVTKLIRSNIVSEEVRQHSKWFFFNWDLIQKTDNFKTFAPYGRGTHHIVLTPTWEIA